ncbi:MAG: radical SAM family heme chaperone HemW [Tissierellia bacterium]|nr:radical SAM family heme chaperone HemW [Tissierellia bacterium]
MMKNKLSVYLHIPFCESRCYYCDFCSSIIQKETVSKYFAGLSREIELYRDFFKQREIETIFIGGGTPSAVDSKYIGKILDQLLQDNSSLPKEISLEANPNSLTKAKLKDYRQCNINRLSLGVQSFNDRLLEIIGRVHRKEDIYRSIDLIHAADFSNFNIDLMSGLPTQSIEDIEESLQEAKRLEPTHLSYYSLILEDHTPMKKIYENKKINFPSEELDREMVHRLTEGLRQLGYEQYEISNYARPGYHCRHNLAYWKLKDYIGLGLSAHSNVGNLRFANSSQMDHYLLSLSKEQFPIAFQEELSPMDRMNEFNMMGLRLNEGISMVEFQTRFSKNFREIYQQAIVKNLNLKRIAIKKDRLSLTDHGRDFCNQVELDFFF